MKIYNLLREQFLPVSVNEAWDFFATPNNLAMITPSDLSFEILKTENDTPIYSGMKIAYRLRPLFNIPVSWITEIKDVNAPHSFTDTQLKGPYSLWQHTHTFVAVPGGVKMTDNVYYALPFGLLGTIVHSIIVKKRLEDIFNFREKTLITFFNKH